MAFWRAPIRIFRGVLCWAAPVGNSSSIEEEELPCLVTSSFMRVHDVVAVSQTVSNNEVMPGDLVDIYVTVRNNGDITETFDVTCYYDSVEIGTVRVIDLAPAETRVVKFTWDTTGVPQNGYPIKALADSSAEIAEVDEDNNWCTMPLNIFVIPELPLGTILATLSMFITLIGYAGFKRYRTKQRLQ